MSFANSASQAKDSATSVSSCCSEPPNLQDLDENQNVCVPVRKMTYLPYTTEASAMGPENLMYPDFCVMQKAAQMPVQMQTQVVQQPYQKRLVETTRASKRSRTVFTSTQLMELEKAFKDCNYLCRSTRYNLSQALHLTERQIKIWFQNRRMKQKKDSNPKKKIGDEKVKREDCCSPAKSTSAPSPAHSADGSELNIPTSSYQQHSPQHQLMQQQPNYAVTTSAPTTALPANNYYTCNSQYAYEDKIVSNNNQASMINYQSCQQNYSTQPSNNLYSYQMNAQNYVQQQQPQHMLQTTQSQQFAQQQQLLQKQSQMYYMNYSANYKFTPSVNYAEQASLPEQQMLPQQAQQQQQQQLLVEQPKLSNQSSESAVVDSVLSNFWTDNLDDITINQSSLQDKQFTSMQDLLEERPMSITSL